MKTWKSKLSSRSLIITASILLSGYLVLILAVTNLGQSRLKESQHRELELKVQSYSHTLEYFFGVTSDEISYLVTDKTMGTFFANLASGMSMEYGLGASLFKLHKELEDKIEKTQIAGTPVYLGFSLIGYNGSLIAKTKSNGLPYIDPIKYSVVRGYDNRIYTIKQNEQLYIQFIKRVTYANEPVAYLVAHINPQVIVDQLTVQEGDVTRSWLELMTPEGDLLIWNTLQEESTVAEKAGLASKLYFESVIDNTPFKLKTWFEPVSEKEIFTSAWFIAGLSFLAVPVVIGLMYIFLINNANIILRTKIKASHKQQRTLSAQNQRLIEEIEKRRLSEQKLAYQATHDALTGLANRQYGNERLAQEIVKAKHTGSNVIVLFIDLDNFKEINDTIGHLAGDDILKQSANRLLGSMRQSDVLVRLGGDEFLLIIPGLENARAAKILASGILALFETPFEWHHQQFFVSASIGLSIYPQDGDSVQQLLASADTAMYRVKQEGRNGFNLYNPDMNKDAQRALALGTRLRSAINNDELELYYQPIVDLSTDKIVGAEALMRWRDEEFGAVSPEEFIPIAEKNGLIHRIGELAISKACMQAAEWQQISPIHLSVNISSVQFRYCEQLYAQIRHALLKSGLDPELLDIEVTESLLFNHNEEVLQLLSRLQSMGIKLTIDDFGTGYSALSYLQKFPFDRLKIDRSFLQQIENKSEDRELVNAILAMAKALKLEVVAEGIESQKHVDYLKGKRCEFGQGYFYSKPVPASEFEQLLHEVVAA